MAKSSWISNLLKNTSSIMSGLGGRSSGTSGGSFGGNSGGGRISSNNSNSSGSSAAAAGSVIGQLTKPTLKDYNNDIDQQVQAYADLLNKYGLGSGGGGGYAMPQRVDIQPMIDAYTNAANAQKASLQTTADQQRSELLNSIKRFQEQTARSQELQRDAFNSSRADLEEAAFQADRSNRISSAARGLGGSGLQQLSQLQTLMSQNNSISDLANENTEVQTQLAEQLANYESDTNTSIQNLMANLANSLSAIDADLGNNIANLRYQEDVRYETARQQAAEAAAASAANARNSYAQALANYEQGLREQYSNVSLLQNLQDDFSDQISSLTSTDDLSIALDNAKEELYALSQENLISNSSYETGLNNLNYLYNSRLNSLNNKNKKSNKKSNQNTFIGLLPASSAVYPSDGKVYF